MLKNVFELMLFKRWMEDNKQLSDMTIDRYTRNVKVFLDTKIDFLDFNEINFFIKDHCIHKRNYQIYYAIIMFLEYKITEKTKLKEVLEKLIKIKMPEGLKKLRKYIPDEILIEIINNMNEDKHKLIALTQFRTGCRIFDIMHVQDGNIIDDIEISKSGKEYKILKLQLTTKGKKKKVVPIYDKSVIDMMKDYINKSSIVSKRYKDYYFQEYQKYVKYQETDCSVYDSNYDRYIDDVKQAVVKCGIDKNEFSSHDWRRLFARKAYRESGYDIEMLKTLLGHKEISTTARYVSSMGEDTAQMYAKLQGVE